MRHKICIEGQDTVPGQFLEKGCLKWDPEKRYPLTTQAPIGPHDVLGWGTDIQRDDETGEVTAEIEWILGKEGAPNLADNVKVLVDEKDMAITIMANHVVDSKQLADNIVVKRVVHSCDLTHLFVTVGVPWAKAFYAGMPANPKATDA